MTVKTLTLTAIVKAKLVGKPYKQIPDDIKEKQCKAEKRKSY